MIETVHFILSLCRALHGCGYAAHRLEGVLALAVLILLQFVITWSSARWRVVHELVASEPTLLLHEGRFLHQAMRRERVNEQEVRQGLRNHGIEDPSGAQSVVLETDGSFSIMGAYLIQCHQVREH